MSGEKGGDAGGRRVAAAAALLAASFFLSQVLAFVRNAVLAYRVGVGGDTDAYAAAFQIPDMLSHFLGISISLFRHRPRCFHLEAHRTLSSVWRPSTLFLLPLP